MPRMTLQDRYAAALLARGIREVLPSPTSKARAFRQNGALAPFYFVGRSGSVRYGNTYSKSIPASEKFKESLLSSCIAR